MYVYGAVPPLTFSIALPSLPSKQDTFVTSADTASMVGSVIVKVAST